MTKRILAGLSGGVDSAVAALILKKQGYEVIGATMSIWDSKCCEKPAAASSLHTKNACLSPHEKDDIEAAAKIAEKLKIPYYVFDCKKEYSKIVLENFKSEYLNGRTPNPCILCNALVKFGVLPQAARNAGLEFDFFATGHYARIVDTKNGRFIARAHDLAKDQSYFLYRLKKEALNSIILPLGEYTKTEIRAIARENNLFVADKPDSQDFYDGDYNELVGAEEKEGNIVDLDGKILGRHKGIWNFTIGQRKGLKISSGEPLYVLNLNSEKNEVVIGPVDKTFKSGLLASDPNYFVQIPFEDSIEIQAKIRSNGVYISSKISEFSNGGFKLTFVEPQKSLAIGQSVVLYKDGLLLGGAVIENVF